MGHLQSALLILRHSENLSENYGQKIMWPMAMQEEADSNGGPAEDVEKQSSG